jgi:hypothetical protein
MTLMAVNLAVCVYAAVSYEAPVAQCINGYVMVPSRDRTMYVQRAVIVAERCIAIDTD